MILFLEAYRVGWNASYFEINTDHWAVSFDPAGYRMITIRAIMLADPSQSSEIGPFHNVYVRSALPIGCKIENFPDIRAQFAA